MADFAVPDEHLDLALAARSLVNFKRDRLEPVIRCASLRWRAGLEQREQCKPDRNQN
jgi:hypothetical protein